MSEFLRILLYVLGGLFVPFIIFVLSYSGKRFYQKGKLKPVSPEIIPEVKDEDDELEDEANDEIETVETMPPTTIPATLSDEVAVTEETPATETTDNIVPEKTDDIVIGDVEEIKEKEVRKKLTLTEKIALLDSEREYLNQICNSFNYYRNLNIRISSRCVSFRLKKKLIAKATVIGKTLKLHLALDVKDFNENVYFQKDLSAVKTYVETPFTVKVKSARGIKNALTLIEALLKKEGAEKKTRRAEINYF